MPRIHPAVLLSFILAVALVGVLASGRAVAREDSDGNREVVAVTGHYANGMEVLYLFDTRTRHLAAYRVDQGRSLKLVAARDCTFDFLLETYGDETPDAFKPAVLRKSWARYNETGEGASPPLEPPSDKPPAGGR
jgi:hypothetical protein